METIHQASGSQKPAGASVCIADKADFNTKLVRKGKKITTY
jgi:hypothetical protein